MAEIATIARPYAEALFKAVGQSDGARGMADQLAVLGELASAEAVRRFADNPKVNAEQVLEVLQEGAKRTLDAPVKNLLGVMIANGRLAALPAVAEQFRALVNTAQGVADAHIASAFPISDADVAGILAPLEQRFGRKLRPIVTVDESLIGGVRVLVGDEVLDTSIKARLENMKAALLA